MKSLKYLILVGLVLVVVAGSVQAEDAGDGFYLGAAVVGSGFVVASGDNTDDIDADSRVSGGVYGGYRYKIFRGLFMAGEVFYHDTSQDTTSSDGDKITVDPQYGLKAHMGYEWGWGGFYSILGVAHLGYELTQNHVRKDEGHFRPLLGMGATYRFNKKISTNLEFTSTRDEIDIAGDEDKALELLTLRLGVNYHF